MAVETPAPTITICSLKGFNPFLRKGQETNCRDLSGVSCGYGRLSM